MRWRLNFWDDRLREPRIENAQSMTFTVRRASVDDAAQIALCLAELGYRTPSPVVADRLRQFATSATDAVFVAVGNPETPVAGVISVHLLPLFHTSGYLARITSLVVLTRVQRHGIGLALVKAAEAFAWEHACQRIEVTSGDHRPDAHAFYQRIGYALDERRFIKRAAESRVASRPTNGEVAG